jgi:hypothetical protein
VALALTNESPCTQTPSGSEGALLHVLQVRPVHPTLGVTPAMEAEIPNHLVDRGHRYPVVMRVNGEHLTRLIRLKWILMAVGFAVFVGFGLTGAMLADAGWKRTNNVMAPVAILGWVAAAFGACLHAYDFIRRNSK